MIERNNMLGLKNLSEENTVGFVFYPTITQLNSKQL